MYNDKINFKVNKIEKAMKPRARVVIRLSDSTAFSGKSLNTCGPIKRPAIRYPVTLGR